MRELYGVYRDNGARRKHLTPKYTTEPGLWRWYWSEEQAEAALVLAAAKFGWIKVKPGC